MSTQHSPLKPDVESSSEVPTNTNNRTSLRPFLLSSSRSQSSPTLPRAPCSTPKLSQQEKPLPPLRAPEIIVSPVDESSPKLIHPAFRHSQRWPDLRGAQSNGNDVTGNGSHASSRVHEEKQYGVPASDPSPDDEASSPVSPVRASTDRGGHEHEADPEHGGSVSEAGEPRVAVQFARRASTSSPARHDGDQPQRQQHAYRALPYPLSPTSPIPTQQRIEQGEKGATPSPPLEAWSSAPNHLNQKSKFAVLFGIGDAVMAFAPIAFIVLGICIAKLHGQEVEGNGFGKNIERTMDLGPTLFPIMFAAVAGKALKITARYCAEHGSKLGTLELLMASQTVWGTFESQVLLKSLSVLGAHLFFLWALSPIGGQASLRVLEFGNVTIGNQSQVIYMSTGNMSPLQDTHSLLNNGNQGTSTNAALNAMYNAVLTAPSQNGMSKVDLWGNPRIPRIDTLVNVTADNNGWLPVPDVLTPGQYSALVGIPVAGVLPVDEVDLEVTSSYLEFSCPWQGKLPYSGNETLPLGRIWGLNGTTRRIGENVFGDALKGTQTTFFLDTDTPFTDARLNGINYDADVPEYNFPFDKDEPSLRDPRTITFGSRYWPPNETESYTILRWCTVTARYVDVVFRCDKGSCLANKMRKAEKYSKRNNNITVLDWNTTTTNLFEQLPRSHGSVQFGRSEEMTMTEKYIRGALNVYSTGTQVVDMEHVTMEDFNDRFTRVMNTYLHLAQGPFAFAGNIPPIAAFGPYGNSTMENGTAMTAATSGVTNYGDSESVVAPWYGFPSMATNKTFQKVYQCNFLWLAVMEASSGILLCLGIAGLIMKIRCRAPDMLGYVASMTYDNPYVVLPAGGCVFSAMERAQRLKRMEVRIGDVQPRSKMGHVAFASVQGHSGIGSLQKERLYV
ncbi:hypothetical protein EJ05DRAFT_484697 [Pseudovirgaria hyperparasitica]|uniref:Uncharacterized protein n=1 Tax=Pseudovirgaria hyperparasitica TaxID=470096 RepID=A0A6A6WCV1_9PEZI|nr:uncharacterized protein EJ05DRAFT_484697 [Pseudovirgaria hyperparasitica]KAF2759790.1 hypothetical protein EJ05DRAFT_484697 [Pseudovirgaria hyperparasitica]